MGQPTNAERESGRMPRCRGFSGMIFGHKFRKGIEVITESNQCYRCGLIPENWYQSRKGGISGGSIRD